VPGGKSSLRILCPLDSSSSAKTCWPIQKERSLKGERVGEGRKESRTILKEVVGLKELTASGDKHEPFQMRGPPTPKNTEHGKRCLRGTARRKTDDGPVTGGRKGEKNGAQFDCAQRLPSTCVGSVRC